MRSPPSKAMPVSKLAAWENSGREERQKDFCWLQKATESISFSGDEGRIIRPTIHLQAVGCDLKAHGKEVLCLRTLSTAHDIKYKRSASTQSSPTLPLQNKTIKRERKQTELFTLTHFFLPIVMKSPAKILVGRLLPKGNAAQELLARIHSFLQVLQPW